MYNDIKLRLSGQIWAAKRDMVSGIYKLAAILGKRPIMQRFFLIMAGIIIYSSCFSQFTRKQDQKIMKTVDSARKVDNNYCFDIYRIHYGMLLGYHQGISPEFEVGIHRTVTDSDKFSSVGVSTSYLRNINDGINSLCINSWFGLLGLSVKANSKDFKKFSYSIQPILGVEYKFLHLFYGYNFNVDSYKTQTLNKHTLALRANLWFITKRGKQEN